MHGVVPHRAGKRSALKEHMATKDHKELVESLLQGHVEMPPTLESLRAHVQSSMHDPTTTAQAGDLVANVGLDASASAAAAAVAAHAVQVLLAFSY